DNKKKRREKGKKRGGEESKKLVKGESERFSTYLLSKIKAQSWTNVYVISNKYGWKYWIAIWACCRDIYFITTNCKRDTLQMSKPEKLNQAIRRGLVNLKYEEGAIDFKGWTTITGMTKSTNRLDDILELTEEGQKYVTQIQQGLVSDLCIWHWVMLSMVAERFSVQLYIEGQHIPTNVSVQHEMAITRLNLSKNVRNQVILSRRADGCTAKEIKLKLLAPFNERNNRYIHDDVEDLTFPSNSPEHYYQLTVSDNMWLEQARDYGLFCFGINAKYDLNNNQAPIHSLVVENCENWGTPIGFALSNKENMHTIRLAVEAIKANIPCKNMNCEHSYEYVTLPNNKGFKRIRSCAIEWKPFAMMDKHRPTKATLTPIIHALAFKIVGRCRSIVEAKEIAIEYNNFINSLPISTKAKAFFIRDFEENWLSQEWILCFIDGGRLPSQEDEFNAKPWTTNNFTERMNRTIEGQYSGTQTVLTFIERLYDIKVVHSNITENCGHLVFNAGLVTYWNSRSIEHQNGLHRSQPDILRRINQGRLIVLQNGVLEISEDSDSLYVHMSNSQQNIFRSPYTADKVTFENNEAQGVFNMIKKLVSKYKIPMKADYYLVNYVTGECTCMDFICHGSFHNFCKHGYAARTYMSIKANEISIDQIKKEFVQYFRNKEQIVASSMKNKIIYSGSDEESYNEILHQYKANGSEMFFPIERQTTENDPFRPDKLPKQRHATVELSKINSTKPRELKNDQIIVENE
ncbi:288_t:CDS:2, partial [Gigaspora rosea]